MPKGLVLQQIGRERLCRTVILTCKIYSRLDGVSPCRLGIKRITGVNEDDVHFAGVLSKLAFGFLAGFGKKRRGIEIFLGHSCCLLSTAADLPCRYPLVDGNARKTRQFTR